MYQIPNIVLVGYGREQVFQNKCLKCHRLFFEKSAANIDSRELFCDICSEKYSIEFLNSFIQPANISENYYVGNVVGWVVKTTASPKRSRYNYTKVYKRDNYTCQYCGYTPKRHEEFFPLHIDHVYPFVAGGSNRMINLVVACQQCNNILSAKVFVNFESKRRYIVKEKIRRNLFYDKNFIILHGMEELLFEIEMA